jgi:hypothetical protein
MMKEDALRHPEALLRPVRGQRQIHFARERIGQGQGRLRGVAPRDGLDGTDIRLPEGLYRPRGSQGGQRERPEHAHEHDLPLEHDRVVRLHESRIAFGEQHSVHERVELA